MEPTRWGIIYCPKEGIRHIHKEWDEIRQYLTEQGILYDFVQSEGSESVERLTGMLVANGYKTIIIVGGDSALYRALNGLLAQEESVRKDVALGVIPNGWGNDFAHFWGIEEGHHKQTINSLVKRRVRKVDVGCCHHGEGLQNKRYFLNCVNVGLVAKMMMIKHKTRRFWGLTVLSHIASIIMLLFQRMEQKMHLKVNTDDINRNLMTVCVGSAKGYGQTPSAVPYNGLLDVSVVSHSGLTQMAEAIYMLIRGSFLNHKAVRSYRTREVMFYDRGKAKVSLDGTEWNEAGDVLKITIQQECINFIIP